jgi:hypothetical protein
VSTIRTPTDRSPWRPAIVDLAHAHNGEPAMPNRLDLEFASRLTRAYVAAAQENGDRNVVLEAGAPVINVAAEAQRLADIDRAAQAARQAEAQRIAPARAGL